MFDLVWQPQLSDIGPTPSLMLGALFYGIPGNRA